MRIFASALLFFVFLVFGFFALFIVIFSGNQIFYAPFIIITGIGLYIFIVLAIFQKFKNKYVVYSFIAFLILAAGSTGGYEAWKAYQKNLEVVSVQDVNLYHYEPFKEGTLAAKLDEESTFKITDSLPKLDGATALYPLYAAFAQAVYPEGEYR